MKLYDLVTLKQSLTRALKTEEITQRLYDLCNQLDNVKIQVPVLSEEHGVYLNELIEYYKQIIDKIEKPVIDFNDRIAIIDQQINSITHQLLIDNYDLEQYTHNLDFVRNSRRIYVNQDNEQDIKQRILFHTDWRYPALEIGCRDGEWTQFMVSADPLYIVDRHLEFLDSTNNRFPKPYQQRLRKYQLKENHDLSMLPQNQMGFVFSWGYFNYVSMDTIKQYLKQIFAILRPGGVFMFSYNDGDTTFGAGMSENGGQTYMPKSMLKPLCESFGYIINKESNYNNQISWIEIRRPGELATTKAHQVLGEIKHQ